MDSLVKPKLEATVFIEYKGSISKEKVLAKGKEIFFHTGCLDDGYVQDYRQPVYFKDYGVRWFKSLSEVRKKYKLKKLGESYYEIVGDK